MATRRFAAFVSIGSCALHWRRGVCVGRNKAPPLGQHGGALAEVGQRGVRRSERYVTLYEVFLRAHHVPTQNHTYHDVCMRKVILSAFIERFKGHMLLCFLKRNESFFKTILKRVLTVWKGHGMHPTARQCAKHHAA
eukprot:EG_transcript_40519